MPGLMRQPLLSKDGSARSPCLASSVTCGTIIGGTLALSLNIYMVYSAGYTFTGPGWAIWAMGLVVGAVTGRFVGTAFDGTGLWAGGEGAAAAQLARGAPFWGSLVLCGSCYTIYTCPFFDTEMYVFRTDYALSYNWSQEQGIVSAAEIGMLLALAAGVFVDSQGPTRCALVAAVLMILGYTAWAVTATESYKAGLALTFLCAQGSAFAYVAALSTNAVNFRSQSRSLPLAACQAASSLASCTYAVCTFALASRPSKSYSAENAALRRVAMGVLAAGTALALWWRSPRIDEAPAADAEAAEEPAPVGLITGKPLSAPKGLASAQGPVESKVPRGLMAGQGAVAAAERRKLLEYSDGGRVLSCVGAWVVFALLVGVSWAEPNGYMMLVPDSVITLYVLAWFAVVAIAIYVRVGERAPYGFLKRPPPLPPSHVPTRAGGSAALAPWSAAWLRAACGSREWLCLAVALAVSAGGDATLRNSVPYLFNAALPHSSNPYPWRVFTDRLTQAYWFSRAAGALLAGYLADRAAAVEVHPESDALRRHALATSGVTERAPMSTSPGSLAALRAALLPDNENSTVRPSAARKANARRAALLAVAVFSMALGQLMLLSVLLTPAGSSLSNTDALNEARSWTIVIGGVLIAAANGAALALMPTLLVALFLEDPEAEGGAPSPLGEARTAFGALYGLMSVALAIGQLALFNGLTVAEFESNDGALWCSGEASCYTTTMAVELGLSVLATLAALELSRCAVGRHIPATLRTAATSETSDRAVM